MMTRVPPKVGSPRSTGMTSLVVVDGGDGFWLWVVSTPPNLRVCTPSGSVIEGVVGVAVEPTGVVLPSQKPGMLMDSMPRPVANRSEFDLSAVNVLKKTL